MASTRPGAETRRPAPGRWRRRAGGGKRAIAGASRCDGGDLLGARRRSGPRAAADRRARRRRGPGRRRPRVANASAPSETLSETSTSATAETARAGRRSVGPASATATPGQHQRPQQRLQRAAGGARSRPATARDQPEQRHGEQRAAARPGARTPARAVAEAARSRRPPPVVADPFDEQQRERQPAAPARQRGRRRARRADRGAPACGRRAPAAAPASCRTRARRPGWRRRPCRRAVEADVGDRDLGEIVARPRAGAGQQRGRRFDRGVGVRARRPGERVGDQQRERGRASAGRSAAGRSWRGDAQAGTLARDEQRHAERAAPRRRRRAPSASRRASAMLTSARSSWRSSGWSRRDVGDHRIAHAAALGERAAGAVRVQVEEAALRSARARARRRRR